jgi:vacuolar-type H+-ATPase subunit H
LEIVDDVLKAEREAEVLINQAREQSQQTLTALDRNLHEREQKARHEQSERITAAFAAVRKESEDLMELKIREIRSSSDNFLNDREDVFDRTAADIIRLVIESPLNRTL